MLNRAAVKAVQNYILQELKYPNKDESELWEAKHKILKKSFTVKRVPLKQQTNQQITSSNQSINKDQWNLQNLMRQVNLLKRHNSQSIPRCHKLIKTTNSIYLVYDLFPGVPLSQFLMQSNSRKGEKIQLLLEIAKSLEEWHSKDIVLLNLTANNIHVFNEKSIFYRDWSLARSLMESKIEEGYKWINSQQDIAPEVIEKGDISLASDVYCLGKIFRNIIHSGRLESPTNEELKVQDLILSMVKEDPKERPSLTQIIKFLKETKGGWPIGNRIPTPRYKIDSTSRTSTRHNTEQDERVNDNEINCLENPFNFSQRYFTKKDVDLQVPQFAFKSLSAKTSNNKQLKIDHIQRRFSIKNTQGLKDFSFNQIKTSRKLNNSIVDIQTECIKKICKKRSLAFFILQLSQFVVKSQLSTILGYLFAKYSRLSFQNLLKDSQKQLSESQKGRKFLSILHDQQVRMAKSETMIKEALCSEQVQQTGFKRQLIDDYSISDRYLNSKIIEFAQLIVIECEKKLSQTNKNDQNINSTLFKTYLILQKIEEGSFEKYWDKEKNREIMDKNPRKQEIHNSQRYLKSKIAEILMKK